MRLTTHEKLRCKQLGITEAEMLAAKAALAADPSKPQTFTIRNRIILHSDPVPGIPGPQSTVS